MPQPKDKGVVNTWNTDKQFGFVSCDNAREDLFLHAENVPNMKLREEIKTRGFSRGDRIRFDIEPPVTGRGKMVAMNVEMDKGQGRSASRGGRSRSRRRSDDRNRSRRSRGRSDSRSRGRDRSRERRR
uniref:CSD domain-containing protein n=1 Tax=Noctiluca scintillans TaxID=2966 RepID=A0A7S1AIN6_NOCSC